MDLPFYKTGENPEILVILDNRKGNTLKQFRCPICGKVVFEYYNNLRVIMSGGLDSDDVVGRCKSPLVIQCKGFVKIKDRGKGKFAACRARFYVE